MRMPNAIFNFVKGMLYAIAVIGTGVFIVAAAIAFINSAHSP